MPNQMDDATIIRALHHCATGSCIGCELWGLGKKPGERPTVADQIAKCNEMQIAAADRLEALAKELRDADSDRQSLFTDLCGANARADEYERERDEWKEKAETNAIDFETRQSVRFAVAFLGAEARTYLEGGDCRRRLMQHAARLTALADLGEEAERAAATILGAPFDEPRGGDNA